MAIAIRNFSILPVFSKEKGIIFGKFSMILEEDGSWMNIQKEISKYFSTNFENLFTNSNPMIDDEIEDLFPDKSCLGKIRS